MSAPGKKNGTWSTGVQVKNDDELIVAEQREIDGNCVEIPRLGHHILYCTVAPRIVQSCQSAFLHNLDAFLVAGMSVGRSVPVKVQHFGVSRDNGVITNRSLQQPLGSSQGRGGRCAPKQGL